MRLNFAGTSFIIGDINYENAPRTFYTPRKAKTSKMRLNLTANSFIFGCINHDNVSRTFSAKHAGRELPKCV